MGTAKPRLIDGDMFGAAVDTEHAIEKHTFVRAGFSIASLPPGEVELCAQSSKDLIDVHLDGPPMRYGFNTDRIRSIAPVPGSVAFMPAGTELRLQANNTKPNLLILFDPSCLPDALDGKDRSGRHRQQVLPWRHHAEIASLARHVVAHLQFGPDVNRLYIESLGTAILALTLPFAAGLASRGPTLGGLDHRVARARDYIEANLASKIELAEIASAACLSPYHFLRTFKTITGETPHVYVTRRRLEEAQVLLATGHLPIVEVALAMGFSSQAHMTTAMRNVMGHSPAAYRKSRAS